jgi:hypothetical protein
MWYLMVRVSPGWLLRGAPAAEPAAAAASALAAAGLSAPPGSLWDSGEWWMLLAAQSMAVGTVRAPRAAALLPGAPRMQGRHLPAWHSAPRPACGELLSLQCADTAVRWARLRDGGARQSERQCM